LNRLVAVKMIRAGLWAGDEEVRRFRNEAEAVAGLDHPQIGPIYEINSHGGQHYFSMKLVGDASLAGRLAHFWAGPKAGGGRGGGPSSWPTRRPRHGWWPTWPVPFTMPINGASCTAT